MYHIEAGMDHQHHSNDSSYKSSSQVSQLCLSRCSVRLLVQSIKQDLALGREHPPKSTNLKSVFTTTNATTITTASTTNISATSTTITATDNSNNNSVNTSGKSVDAIRILRWTVKAAQDFTDKMSGMVKPVHSSHQSAITDTNTTAVATTTAATSIAIANKTSQSHPVLLGCNVDDNKEVFLAAAASSLSCSTASPHDVVHGRWTDYVDAEEMECERSEESSAPKYEEDDDDNEDDDNEDDDDYDSTDSPVDENNAVRKFGVSFPESNSKDFVHQLLSPSSQLSVSQYPIHHLHSFNSGVGVNHCHRYHPYSGLSGCATDTCNGSVCNGNDETRLMPRTGHNELERKRRAVLKQKLDGVKSKLASYNPRGFTKLTTQATLIESRGYIRLKNKELSDLRRRLDDLAREEQLLNSSIAKRNDTILRNTELYRVATLCQQQPLSAAVTTGTTANTCTFMEKKRYDSGYGSPEQYFSEMV